jgi:hypothetical protein
VGPRQQGPPGGQGPPGSRPGPARPVDPPLKPALRRLLPGWTVAIQETVEALEALIDGEVDDLPEQDFFNVGYFDDARAKAKDVQRR